MPRTSAPLCSWAPSLANNRASLAIRPPKRFPLTLLTQRDKPRESRGPVFPWTRTPYMAAMSIRPWRDIERRQSRQIMVGSVPVGGDAPITVQTMTNTPTEDAKATIDQIRRCEDAGADIIRVSCPTAEATAALKEIVRAARVPIVADIHFHYKRALEARSE